MGGADTFIEGYEFHLGAVRQIIGRVIKVDNTHEGAIYTVETDCYCEDARIAYIEESLGAVKLLAVTAIELEQYQHSGKW